MFCALLAASILFCACLCSFKKHLCLPTACFHLFNVCVFTCSLSCLICTLICLPIVLRSTSRQTCLFVSSVVSDRELSQMQTYSRSDTGQRLNLPWTSTTRKTIQSHLHFPTQIPQKSLKSILKYQIWFMKLSKLLHRKISFYTSIQRLAFPSTPDYHKLNIKSSNLSINQHPTHRIVR
jgi:hypothetical protein